MANKKKCRYCKTYSPASEGIQVPLGHFCSMAHAIEYSRREAPTVRRKQVRKDKREYLADNLPHQLKLTQTAFNKLIRLLDKGKPCISSGKPWADTFHAGHFKTVGAHPELRFDARNCHGQSAGDNLATDRRKSMERSVMESYEANLVQRYGQAIVDYLNGPHEPKHYTCDELREMRKVFNAESRRLEAGEPPSKDWRTVK